MEFQSNTLRIEDVLKSFTDSFPIDFPIDFYNILLTNSDSIHEIPLHCHKEFQIDIVISGSLKIRCDKMDYIIHENQGIFFNSYREHAIEIIDSNESRYIECVFAPEIIRNFEGSNIDIFFMKPIINSSKISAVLINDDGYAGSELFEEMKYSYNIFREEPIGYQLLVISSIFSIWQKLISILSISGLFFAKPSPIQMHDYKRVDAFMTFIHDNYMEDISLSDIAGSINLSSGECDRFFKRILNCSPFEYLKHYRIKQSTLLLGNLTLPISAIAVQVGFNSFSYFTSCFKEIIGCTPREYRNKIFK